MTIHEAPCIETARLRLRPHTVADLDALFEVWADPLVTKYIGGRASTREQSWARLLRYAGMWPLLGCGFWAIEERETGRYAGEAGVGDFHREMTPAIMTPESGWVLASWAHGRGYATEAVQAALRWCDERPPLAVTTCIIEVPNVASQRVAAKCGDEEVRRAVHEGCDFVVLQRGK